MFDTIKRIVADKTEQVEALELIQHVGVPLVKLKVKTASLNGEIEIADGKRIVRARANPGKDTGLQALLRVLSATECSLELVAVDVIGSRTEELNLKVEEVLADEKAFIERVKNILWPVDADKKVIATHFVDSEDVVNETAEMVLQPHGAELGVELSATTAPGTERVAEDLIVPASLDLVEEIRESAPLPKHVLPDVHPSEETCDLPAVKLDPESNFAPVTSFEETMDLTEALATRGSLPDDSEPLIDPVRDELANVSETVSQLDEQIGLDVNDLEERRKAELAGLDAMLSDRTNEFQRKRAGQLHEEEHAIIGERKEEFDRLKEFYEEDPEKFYDKTDLSDLEAAVGLDDFKSRILEIVSEESVDPVAFAEADPALQNQQPIRPVWEAEKEKDETERDEIEPTVEEYVPPPLTPSPFAEATSDITDANAFKDKLTIEGAADNKTLLERRPGDHAAGVVDRDSLPRSKPISKSAYVAAGIALLAVPMFGFGLNNYANVQAQADSEETADVRAMVASSVEEQSQVNQPQQAFRMPAGSVSPTGGGGGSGLSGGIESVGVKPIVAYSPSSHPLPRPTGAELNEANKVMQEAQRFSSQGRVGDAARLYSTALSRCPGYVQLRIAAIQAYMQLKDFKTARRICLAGMVDAASQADFDSLNFYYLQLP